MEARFVLRNLFAFALLILFLDLPLLLAQYPGARRGQANYRASSRNFTVNASDTKFAQKVAEEAERFRKELAIEWLGKELPPWNQKCPITVQLGMHAGGYFPLVVPENVVTTRCDRANHEFHMSVLESDVVSLCVGALFTIICI